MAEDYNISIDTKVQLDELQKLLEELRALNAEVSKIGAINLSGINASINELSKTGKTLTEALNLNKKSLDSFSKSTVSAKENVKNLKEETSRSEQVFTGFHMELGAIGARFATQLPAALFKSIEAFGRQEMAVQKLSAAVRSNGGNVSEVLPIMRQFASEIQRITTYGDEQVLAMQAMASSMGVSSDQMQSVIRSAIGLASALNMDVMTAVKAASAAVQGKTGALQEYIPALSKCKTEEEKLAEVQKLSASGFAQAKAEAETTSGRLKQCANAWGDLAETAGGVFAPVATDIAGLLKGMCEVLSENSGVAALLTGTLTSLSVAMAFSKIGGLPSVITLLKLTGGALLGVKGASDALNLSLKSNPIGAAIGVAIAAVTALTTAYSYFKGKAEETYKKNIEQSAEYRSSIDAEIESMKQWGLSADANKKRTAAVAGEIERLKAAREKFRANAGTRGEGWGGGVKILSDEDRAKIDNYTAKIEKLEERQKAAANVKELDALAAKNHAEVMRQSAEILKKSEEEMAAARDATTALAQTRERLAAATREVADLEKALAGGGVADSERVAKANRLAAARREILELGKQELEQAMQLAAADYAAEKSAELGRQYGLEMKLAQATAAGDAAAQNAARTALEQVQANRRRLDIETAFIESKRAEIRTEEDLAKVRADAAKYAETVSNAQRERAATEKWLADQMAAVQAKSRERDTEILRARASGNEELARELEAQQRIARLSAEIFEASRKEGMTRAELEALARSANAQARERIDLEKSITDETARQADEKRTRQLSAELDILRARASGNESLARELEAQRRIAQLANEIFESSRREGMSRAELEALQNSANAQARERFNLEKSITDEAQRQNLAKNAQAKIEDIILANKIEQLKSEGKIAEAQELEQEREIKRTMAGLQGVSEEDKKKLADMMRQTNDFKAGAGSAQGRSGEDVSSALSRKNSMMGGGGGQNTLTSGGRGRNGMPATVSAKYADKYAQFKEARKSGAIGANVGWTDFRDGKTGVGGVSKERRQAQARGILDSAGETARQMSGLAPRGVADSASSLMSAQTQRKNPAAKAAQPTPATADAALGQELQKRGSDGKGGDPKKNTDNIEKMTKALDDCLQSLKDIKNNTAAMATKKKDN